MTKRARFIAFEPNATDLARSFCMPGPPDGGRAAAGKRHWPGTGAQSLGVADWRCECGKCRKASPVRLVIACNEQFLPFVFGN